MCLVPWGIAPWGETQGTNETGIFIPWSASAQLLLFCLGSGFGGFHGNKSFTLVPNYTDSSQSQFCPDNLYGIGIYCTNGFLLCTQQGGDEIWGSLGWVIWKNLPSWLCHIGRKYKLFSIMRHIWGRHWQSWEDLGRSPSNPAGCHSQISCPFLEAFGSCSPGLMLWLFPLLAFVLWL